MKNDKKEEVALIIHKTTGLLNFLGGALTVKQVEDMTFQKVLELIIFNGGKILITEDVNYINRLKE